jgi:hypothetical protein
MPRGVTNPVRQRGAIQLDALAGVDLGLPVQRQMIGILDTRTCAIVASVGMPPSISRAGAGAWMTPSRNT